MGDTSSHKNELLFSDLLDYLRRNGFSVGVDSHLRLQKVLAAVGGDCTPEELRTLLCPILATDKKQQEFFYSAFDAYLGLIQSDAPDAPAARHPAPNRARPKSEPLLARRWPYVLAGVLLAVAVFFISQSFVRQAQKAAAQPGPTQMPVLGSLTPVIRQLPVPEWLGPFRLLALIAPLLIWLLYEGYLWKRQRLLLSKLSSDYLPDIRPVRPPGRRPSLFASERFYRATRLLRSRQVAEYNVLDIGATIAATIKSVGFPSLHFRRGSKLPEYLVLIERKTPRDHLCQFFDELVTALGREGIYLTRYHYEGDPRVCFKPPRIAARVDTSPETEAIQGEQSVSLPDVLNQHEGCRLLIFGSGEGLLNPLTGAPEEWARLFGDMRERGLLTPVVPGEWSFRELTLAEEFFIAPSTFDGLNALNDYYETGEAHSPHRWTRDQPVPSPLDLDSLHLLKELKTHLGEKTFYWLCACAVYPSLQWELTTHLGALPCIAADLTDEYNVLRLIRLPWFRSGFIPDRLRRLLINQLPPEIYDEVRRTIIDIMRGPEEADGTQDDAPDGLNVTVPRMFSPLSEMGLRKTTNAWPTGGVFRDHIFVRFLASTPSALLSHARLSSRLKDFLFTYGNTALRVRLGWRILLVALTIASLWLEAPRIVLAIGKTEPTLTAEPSFTPTPTPAPALDLTPSPSPQANPSPTGTGTPSTTGTTQRTPPPSVTPTPPTQPSPGPATPDPVTTPTLESTPITTPTAAVASTPDATPSAQPTPTPETAVVCPEVRVECLSGYALGQGYFNFDGFATAKVTGGKVLDEPPKFFWSLEYLGTVSNARPGVIVEGQGTPRVRMLWSASTKYSATLTIKVVVTGYNATCSTESSCAIRVLKGAGLDVSNPCGGVSCGRLLCQPSPGYCIDCGNCGPVCCTADQ